jgi:flagellar motor switch/type III secretory pathway protein FliN
MSDVSDSLAQFHHVPFRVELELGRIALDIQTILRLREGDVLRTNQPAGAGVRLLAGGVEIATADIVTVKEKAAARITTVAIPPARGDQRGNP